MPQQDSDNNLNLTALVEEQKEVERQIAEDTCEVHKQFCCPICFDMGTVE